MTDELDVDLQDPELIAEILLVGDLMVAASESSTALSQDVIDHILSRPIRTDHVAEPTAVGRSGPG